VATPFPDHLAGFWRGFTSTAACAVDEARFYEAFCFGDSAELADELAALVLAGRKQATAASLWSFEADGRRPPQPGDLSIAMSSGQQPLCVIETLAIEVLPFHAVGAAFAAAEGEGDGSLASWRIEHARYFSRECAAAGRQFDEAMPVVCEHFRVVYRPGAA
jgi:uncharacterized protein YhfF